MVNKTVLPLTPRKDKIAIGLGTFQRPNMLADTLESLVKLKIPEGAEINLILADNDEACSAEEIFQSFKDRLPFAADYIVEPERGIVYFRNSVLKKAIDINADFVAFIDDDETVDPLWLDEMLKTLRKYNADVVDGAVDRILPEETPKWIRRGKFLDWHSFKTGTLRQSGSTSNILFKIKLVKDWGLRFHPALNFAGASDTFLFRQAYLKGAKIVWMDERYVQEHFPPSRVTRGWILRRAFRRTNSKFIRKRLEFGYPRAAITYFFNGIFQVVIGGLLSIISLPFGPMLRLHAQRIFVKGLGTFNGIFGKTYEEYRRTHGN